MAILVFRIVPSIDRYVYWRRHTIRAHPECVGVVLADGYANAHAYGKRLCLRSAGTW